MNQHVTPKPPLGPSFHRLLASSGLANLADGIGIVAWPWLASLITRDPLAIALVGVAQKLPWFLFALPSGVISDRLDRRWLVISMDFLRCATLLGLALALVIPGLMPQTPVADFPTIPLYCLLLLAALIVGFAEVLRDNCAITLLPSIVSVDRLETANGRMGSVETLMNMMIGPPLAGLVIGLALPLAFGLYGLAFALAGLLVLSIPGRFRTLRPEPRHWVAEIREGAAYLFARPLLRDLAIALGVLNAVEMMMLTGLVLYGQEVMGLNSAQYGLLLTGAAVGGVIGGLGGEAVIRRIGQSACLRLATATFLVQALVIFLVPLPILVWGSFFLVAATNMIWNIITLSLRQRAVPPHLLGRVNSVYRFFGLGTMPLGLVLSGVSVTLAETVLPRSAALAVPFALGAILSLLLLVAIWTRVSPKALADFHAG
ncbi:MFS family permease [Peteryoungia aggregata LMG 23059]|uniref:MFS family permease n=1 Tax=Peteryoungia aggregata LMG 23059 TaxID=1368425 RepID=A0ABU0GD81_9HYPH|nr:MFS transporter [Peteryoungia aggregata]MDQ0423316.1 MFS family permease [Peteryoungia aggregata LMG 23059]